MYEEDRENNTKVKKALEDLKERIQTNPDDFIIEKMDNLMNSLDNVGERISENEGSISMWEHLHELLYNLEDNPENVIDEEIERIDNYLAKLEE